MQFNITHLEHFLLQESPSKHCHSFSADFGVITSGEVKGGDLFTVKVECNRLPLHTVRQSVPPTRSEVKGYNCLQTGSDFHKERQLLLEILLVGNFHLRQVFDHKVEEAIN